MPKCPVCQNKLTEYTYHDDGPYGSQVAECGEECLNCGYSCGNSYGLDYEHFPYPTVLPGPGDFENEPWF